MEAQAVTSKGCARGYIVFVLWHAWQHVRQLKSEDIAIIFPFDEDVVVSWIEQARIDCTRHSAFITIFGGTEFDTNDHSTYWTSSSNFCTWWKNNIERKSKFGSLAKDAVTREDLLVDAKRPSYCREAIALATNIRNHFDRIVHRMNLPYIPQVSLPFPLPTEFQLQAATHVHYKYMTIEQHICELYPGLAKLAKKYRPAKRNNAVLPASHASSSSNAVQQSGCQTPVNDEYHNNGHHDNDGDEEQDSGEGLNPPPPPAKRRKPNNKPPMSTSATATTQQHRSSFDNNEATILADAHAHPDDDIIGGGASGAGGVSGGYRTRSAVRNKDHHHHPIGGPSLCNLDDYEHHHCHHGIGMQQPELTHFDDHHFTPNMGDFDTMFGSSSSSAFARAAAGMMMPSSMAMSSAAMPVYHQQHLFADHNSAGLGNSTTGLISLPVKFRSSGGGADDSCMGCSGIDDHHRNSNNNDVYCGYVLVPVNRVSVSAVMGAGFAPGGFITPPVTTPVPVMPQAASSASGGAGGWNVSSAAAAAANEWQPLLEASAFDRYQPPRSADSSQGRPPQEKRSKAAADSKDCDEISIETSTHMMSKITMRSRPSSSAAMMMSDVSRPHFIAFPMSSSHSSLGMINDNNELYCDIDNDLINAYLADIRSDQHESYAAAGQSEGQAGGVEEEVVMHDYLQCFLPINEPIHYDGDRRQDSSDDENAANALLRLHDGLSHVIDTEHDEDVAVEALAVAEEDASEEGNEAEDTRMEF